MLLSVTEQLKQESQRADDNERRAREAIQRFRAINDARVAAQQDSARANEELRMYKLQLDYAQKEIYKAQAILESLEDQRHDAETNAAKARNVARRLREDNLVDLAREEGRRLGLQEGLSRSRRLGFDQAHSTSDRRDSRPVQKQSVSCR
jgi:chromosome segregation ATPase